MKANKTYSTVLKVLLHVVSWAIFLSLPSVFKPRPANTGFGLSIILDDIMEPPRWTNSLLLIVVFYFNYYYAIPRLYIPRRYGVLAVSIFICFADFALLNYLLTPPEIIMNHPSGGFEALGNSFNLFMFLIIYVYSFALCLYDQWQRTKDQMLAAEISFLKAQINPHFLFNTLNSIYSLALAKSDKTPDAIVKLSGIMRYSVSDGNQDLVSLSHEIGYITDYIELQQLRLTSKVKISYEVAGNADGRRIAPFVLIPFVENAFRYGVNSEEDSDINIKIELTQTGVILMVANNKVFVRQEKGMGTGLGISNTRKRLKLLYPGRHTLRIDDNTKEFSILLQIQFT